MRREEGGDGIELGLHRRGAGAAGGNTAGDAGLERDLGVKIVFEDDLYTEISLKTCVARRISAGGTGPASVQAQLDSVAAFLAAHQ